MGRNSAASGGALRQPDARAPCCLRISPWAIPICRPGAGCSRRRYRPDPNLSIQGHDLFHLYSLTIPVMLVQFVRPIRRHRVHSIGGRPFLRYCVCIVIVIVVCLSVCLFVVYLLLLIVIVIIVIAIVIVVVLLPLLLCVIVCVLLLCAYHDW